MMKLNVQYTSFDPFGCIFLSTLTVHITSQKLLAQMILHAFNLIWTTHCTDHNVDPVTGGFDLRVWLQDGEGDVLAAKWQGWLSEVGDAFMLSDI